MHMHLHMYVHKHIQCVFQFIPAYTNIRHCLSQGRSRSHTAAPGLERHLKVAQGRSRSLNSRGPARLNPLAKPHVKNYVFVCRLCCESSLFVRAEPEGRLDVSKQCWGTTRFKTIRYNTKWYNNHVAIQYNAIQYNNYKTMQYDTIQYHIGFPKCNKP